MPINHRKFVAWTADPWANDGKDILELLKHHGLKPGHRLLDFGCGSLRVGRWLIDYLDADRYFGIDPNTWLIEMAKLEEVPAETWEAKRPTFDGNDGFNLDVFDTKFDYVVMSSVLVHAADWQIAKVIHGLDEVLAPGGMGLANIIHGPHYGGDEWQYPAIACHPPRCLIDPSLAAGLRCEAVEVLGFRGLSFHWFKFTREDA